MKKCNISQIPEAYRYCLVPGCMLWDDQTLSMPPILVKRLEILLMIADAIPDMRFIISGTQYDTKAMTDYLNGKIDPERLLIDTQGHNTISSVKNADQFTADRHLLLLTSNFHQRRLSYTARQLGWDPLTVDTASLEKKPYFPYVVREYAALLKTFFILHFQGGLK